MARIFIILIVSVVLVEALLAPLFGEWMKSLIIPVMVLVVFLISFSLIFGGSRGPDKVFSFLGKVAAGTGILIALGLVNTLALLIRVIMHVPHMDRITEDLMHYMERMADAFLTAYGINRR